MINQDRPRGWVKDPGQLPDLQIALLHGKIFPQRCGAGLGKLGYITKYYKHWGPNCHVMLTSYQMRLVSQACTAHPGLEPLPPLSI